RAPTTSPAARCRCARVFLSLREGAVEAALSGRWAPRSPEKCHRVHVDRPLVAHGDAIEDAHGIAAQNDLRSIASGALRRERGGRPQHLRVVSGGIAKHRRELVRSTIDALDIL